jgi:hypothetical protein
MKKTLIIAILFANSLLKAQEFSYGLVFGNSFYGVANNNGTSPMTHDKYSTLTYGAYGEYYFTENIAIKNEILFSKYDFYYHITKQPFEMNFLTIAPNLKYDFGEVKQEGFYMLLGPKFSFITNVNSEGINVKNSFESIIYGVQLGFGYRVFKYIDLQTKLEYDLSPFFELENGNKSSFFHGVISANIDLAKIFSK